MWRAGALGRLRVVLAGVALLSLVSVSGVPGRATALTNGDFSAGLDGWTSTGPVSVDSGELVLADDGAASSGAWQVVPSEGARARLEFELLPSLSPLTPSDPFGFPDLFTASVYALDAFDEGTGFDPAAGTAISAVSVLSYDADGPYDVFADLGPSVRGGDWLHVSFEFDTPQPFFAPSFELFELAFAGGDSVVRIDDVVVTAVPEPGTGLLLGLALVAAARARRGRG